jgi:signal peptidase
MSPALEVGDLAIIQKVDTATVKTGDIIQFYKDNTTILHRVIRIDINEGRNQYVTKGDANKDPDIAPVPATDILGKSIFTIPKLGWIQIFIKNILRSLGLSPE